MGERACLAPLGSRPIVEWFRSLYLRWETRSRDEPLPCAGYGLLPDAHHYCHLVAALSLAGDLGIGLPVEHCLRACYIGLHVASELGLGEDIRDDVFRTLLLKDAGCTSFTTQAAAFLRTDEIAA